MLKSTDLQSTACYLQDDPLFDFEHYGWKYLKHEALPQLVLAIEIEAQYNELPNHFKPELTSSRTWYPICHQTAGNQCHSRYLWATLLQPAPQVFRGLVTLSNRYLGSLLGGLDAPRLDDLIAYRHSIQELVHPQADCNQTYQDLAEAFYPFDLSCLKLLTKENLPQNLNTLIAEPPKSTDPLDTLLTIPPKWKLVLLGTNCD